MSAEATSEPWREAARAAEAACLGALARGALSGPPGGRALRDLASGAALLQPSPAERAQAVALVRHGLQGQDEEARWDAAHAAGELGLSEVADDLPAALGSARAPVRARVAEALGQLAPEAARARLEPLRTGDPDWTVRRLTGEALRRPGRPASDPQDPFSRYRALVRTGRARQESAVARPDPRALARLGLRLPPALRAFLLEVCPGGKVQLEGGPGGGPLNLVLFTPLELAARVQKAAAAVEALAANQDYVWQRYVEGARSAPKVDEDQALRRYGSRYDGGLVDAEAWSYGVLLFESAFRDEARRSDLLFRARELLAAYREHSGEAWDVVDDRLAEAQELVAREGLRPDPQRQQRLAFATLDGVVELQLDLLHPGVWACDPETGTRQLAPSLAAFLADPRLAAEEAAPQAPQAPHAPAANGAAPQAVASAPQGPARALEEAAEHLAAGRLRQAGRAFGDALEADRSAAMLERAATLLLRPELTPLLAAQLLAVVPLAGDKPSLEAVRAALAALPPERALAMIEAVGPQDEDGSQVSLLIDAAAGIRKKSHAAVTEAARRLKRDRGRAHLRTTRNPFYK